MPVIFHENLEPEGELGLWRIEESEEWFRGRLRLAPAETVQLDKIRGRRRTEWLAARQLVHQMSGREHRGAFIKDEHGKPHLEDSRWHISISHSHELAAAIAALRPVGIDVQWLVPKIERLAYKFMRPEETASLRSDRRIEHLHVFWGAKEALYKAYGRRRLDFCADLRVEPFSFASSTGETTAIVEKGDFFARFRINYRLWPDYVLVFAVEDTG